MTLPDYFALRYCKGSKWGYVFAYECNGLAGLAFGVTGHGDEARGMRHG